MDKEQIVIIGIVILCVVFLLILDICEIMNIITGIKISLNENTLTEYLNEDVGSFRGSMYSRGVYLIALILGLIILVSIAWRLVRQGISN